MRHIFRRETFDYIAIGIKPNGHKKVIDYCITPREKIEVWTQILQNMKSRGLKQAELFLSDGVVGMKTALARTYPKAHFQRCLVHVIRNICATVRVDDREQIMNEFKHNRQARNKQRLSCMSFMPNGIKLAYSMSSKACKKLSPIC